MEKLSVIGHEWAIQLLKQQEQAGRVAQALLISGPAHLGKRTLARFYAQYLNCLAEPKPCGQCLACRKIRSGSHPDVRVLAETDKLLKIEQIRELQRELSLSAYEGRYRVALLGNFERATTSAANALLKTLEEPAEQVVLILTATDPKALLPTIVSRCQGLALRPLPLSQVVEALQTQWQATPDQAEILARLSGGRLGWAVRALADETMLIRRREAFLALTQLLGSHRVERLSYAQEHSYDPATLREVLLVWLTVWRDLLLLQSGSQTQLLNLDWQEELRPLAAQLRLAQIREMVDKVRTTLINLDYNVNVRLNLENLLLHLPKC